MSVRLFVGNLSYDVTESDLRDFFQPVGQLSAVILPMDRETGKPRGFAFVEFTDRAKADEAIRRFNNQPLKGRNVAINEARARESQPGPGAGDRPRAPHFPRPGFVPRPATAGAEIDFDPLESGRASRGERRIRQFSGDSKPARKKKQRQGSRGGDSNPRKGPIRERSGGQFFGGTDDDEGGYDFEDDSEYKRRW